MPKENRENGERLHVKAVFIIADWDKVKVISELVGKANAICYVSKGLGTANSEILDMLGIGSIDKAVFSCFMEESQMYSLVQTVRQSMGARSAGAGIAFSVQLSGTTSSLMKMFADMQEQDGPSVQKAKKETLMASLLAPKEKDVIAIKNDMIISVLNAGYSDAFMTTARKAGAQGGTVISARGLSKEKAKKFLGISLQEEKEIVLILSSSEARGPIMQAVSREFGVSTKAGGLIFSLPVDQVMSLNAL